MNTSQLSDEDRALLEIARRLSPMHRRRLKFAAESIADDQAKTDGGGAVFCNGCVCWRGDTSRFGERLDWNDSTAPDGIR